MTKDQAIKFAVSSADSAIAEQSNFESLTQSIECYRDNIRDTLCDCGCAEFEDAAWAAYNAEIAKYQTKG